MPTEIMEGRYTAYIYVYFQLKPCLDSLFSATRMIEVFLFKTVPDL